MKLEILFDDPYLVAINKPSGLLVHRSNLDKYEVHDAQSILSEQIGQRVFPVHRLDKPTSGVLLFCKDPELMKKLHHQHGVEFHSKKYLLICRGFTPDSGIIEKPLRNPERPRSAEKPALTRFKRLAVAELSAAFSRYETARFSLVEAEPMTGRTHQIRMHFAHLRHYILGDRKHGERHYNRYFREVAGIHSMMLHARALGLKHPISGDLIQLQAALPNEWVKALKYLSWQEELLLSM